MIVYKITNKINNKTYIGQTIQELKSRWSKHCSRRKNSALSMAIHKYGKENFILEILETCNSIEEMNKKEKEHIVTLNTLSPNGYNLTSGGKNGLHTEETKRKIGEAQLGDKNHQFGKKASPEIRAMISEGQKNRKPLTEEGRKRASERVTGDKHPMYGKHHCEEAKHKIAMAHLGQKRTKESIEKMRRAQDKKKKPIICNENGETYPSRSAAAKDLNITPGKISAVLQGKRNHTRGYTFREP